MTSKGLLGSLAVSAAIMMMISGFLLLSPGVDGTAPEINTIDFFPQDPTIDDEFNISVVYDVYDEPIIDANIQICIGGTCFMMEDMEDDGSGTTYWKVYPPGSFPADKIIEFHFYLDYGQGLKMMHGENVTFDPVPHDVFLNGTLSTNTLKPEQMVEVNGNLTFDIGGMVEGADIDLSIASLEIYNNTTTDMYGNFSIGLTIPEEGEHTLSLNATFGSFTDHMEWEITVSPWDLPNMMIDYESVEFDDMDTPPGAPIHTFYTDSNVTLSFNIHNTGTDEARNITASITVENASEISESDAGDLLPGERFPASYDLNTSKVGHFEVNITADWEQQAPFPEGFVPPTFSYSYDIVPRPQWTGHTVFVEMFTQTTCGPCVYVEESLEQLYHEGVDFQFVIYVTEDTESGLIAEGLGITSTPVLFIDDDLFRKDGASDDLDNEMEEIKELIEDAASIETPPVRMEFLDGDSLSINSYLDPEYRDTVSGIIEIYRIEVHSNMRNYQDLPMSHRYLGSVAGQEINDLQPGGYFNFSVEYPNEGEALVAVLKGNDGMVIQTTTFTPAEEPEGYLGTDQAILTIESGAQDTFELVIERFQTEQAVFDDIEVMITPDGLPEGWRLKLGEENITAEGLVVQLTHGGSQMETKPVGRIRYFQQVTLTVVVPDDVEGTFNFDVLTRIGNYTYDMLVVVLVPEPGTPEINISDYYLVGEGKSIYFYVKVSDLPDGAIVKGRILPCNYGDNAACGLPQDFLLTPHGENLYRASVIGVDLNTYTHLTFHAWIEYEGISYSQTEEVQVEIGSLVTITGDDDDDEPISPWVFIFSVGALVFALVLAALLFFMARRTKEEEDEPIEEVEGEIYNEITQPEKGVALVEEGSVSDEQPQEPEPVTEEPPQGEQEAEKEPEE